MSRSSEEMVSTTILNRYLSDKYISNFLEKSLIAILLVLFSFYILRCLLLLTTTFPIEYGEGIILNLAVQLDKYGTYYLDINDYPFTHGAYPPGFIIFAYPLLKLLGPEIYIGRIISIIATLSIGLVVYLISTQQGHGRKRSLTFALFVFPPFFVYTWTPFGRVDSLAILFSVIGLYVYVKKWQSHSNLKYLSCIFFVFAFLTKQNSVAAPCAILAYHLLVERNLRDFFKDLILFAGPLLLIMAALNGLTDGEFFLHTFTHHAFVGISLTEAFRGYYEFIRASNILLLIGILGVLLRKRPSIFLFYTIFTFAILITNGKPGAKLNYYIEPYIALLLLVSSYHNLLPPAWGKHTAKAILSVMLLLSLPSLVKPDDLLETVRRIRSPSDIESRYEIVNEVLAKAEGDVLSENVGYLVVNHREVLLYPFQFMMMSRSNLWDPGPLAADCRRGRFAVVFSGWRIESIDGIRECLEEKYFLFDEKLKIYLRNDLREKFSGKTKRVPDRD